MNPRQNNFNVQILENGMSNSSSPNRIKSNSINTKDFVVNNNLLAPTSLFGKGRNSMQEHSELDSRKKSVS